MKWKDQDWLVANGWGLTSAMLVATTTFLASEGEGSKTSICSAIVRPECSAIGLRRSLFSVSLDSVHMLVSFQYAPSRSHQRGHPIQQLFQTPVYLFSTSKEDQDVPFAMLKGVRTISRISKGVERTCLCMDITVSAALRT
jgi:hypothetical protein